MKEGKVKREKFVGKDLDAQQRTDNESQQPSKVSQCDSRNMIIIKYAMQCNTMPCHAMPWYIPLLLSDGKHSTILHVHTMSCICDCIKVELIGMGY